MTALSRFVWIFTSPDRVFEDIKEGRTSWWQPWLLVSIVGIILGVVNVPTQLAVLELNVNNLDPEQLEQQIEMTQKFGALFAFTAPIGLLFMGLIIGGITYIPVSLLAVQASFKKYLCLVFYSTVITVLYQVVSTVAVRMRGPGAIESPEDAQVFFTSLRFLAPADSAVLKGVFTSIEFFTIWGLVVAAMGLMSIFGLTRNQSLGVVIPWWVLTAIMATVGQLAMGV